MTTSRYQGMLQIVRFNRPMYVRAAIVLLVAATGLTVVTLPREIAAIVATGVVISAFWLLTSLIVSHLVYDRSPLRKWRWVEQALACAPRRWINLHAGLDESTPALHELFAGSSGRVFDIFDAGEMTEPSILRARELATNAIAPERANYWKLPVATDSCDAAFLLLSAHELRHHDSRAALFRELHRVLRRGGHVVLAEHLRDLPNFLAFGPGFLHFHSRRTWRRSIAAGGLAIEREFRITPFVKVFVLRRSS